MEVAKTGWPLPAPTVGLLGGSFNPAHEGHLWISRQALTRLGLHQVWWLVSPQNPLKPSAGMARQASRIAHAGRVATDPRIRVTGLEADLGTTFTADTLPALARRFPRTRFVWLMGADNLLQISHWQRWPQIFHAAVVAVFDRGSYSRQVAWATGARRFARQRLSERECHGLAQRRPPQWVLLHIPRHPASATALRASGRALIDPPQTIDPA
ncbi:MAG: nicotinate-nucleotide adenylyltransferase [Rhodospirillaceae bacterium]|nr:nicotinate-nucleotide adenylyltransferase [Rhodospirillaceae bacterium]